MILLTKLILAHLIGDFVLQPSAWVESKQKRKIASPYLYIHCFLHGVFAMVLLWDLDYWLLAVLVALIHAVIDLLKLYLQKPKNAGWWFLGDQALHLASLLVLWMIWARPEVHFFDWVQSPLLWLYLTAFVFLSFGVGFGIQVVMGNWTADIQKEKNKSLAEAGRYIGILERLLTFVFIVTDHWEAVGFLLAAKSVFRFGDLKESKDRKLTEYILIGTLLSFGIAIFTGLLILKISAYL
ncbi:DUF3307 domain-containing protein [Mariniradius sediminis]|uniref:DUF3307 domain-containing protein n=1 Tax=Mariniradius sediminis TaxID=2909237 RepID=A0ABS9BY63_9BACT|nr:DUF3307 domain-containing protein [Mariniradius sediminis]MCF1752996.1 DUF3307 domain-containing protein [Mariniradius sediminis]